MLPVYVQGEGEGEEEEELHGLFMQPPPVTQTLDNSSHVNNN